MPAWKWLILSIAFLLPGLASTSPLLAPRSHAASGDAVLHSPWDRIRIRPTQAPFSCSVPTHVSADLDLNGFYADPSYSVIDPVKLKAYEAASQPVSQLADRIAVASDAYRASGNVQAARCAFELIATAAKDHALAGTMYTKQAYYLQGWMAGAFALDYLKIRYAAQFADSDRESIDRWFQVISQQTMAYYELQISTRKDGGDAGNNHLNWAALEIAAIAVVLQDRSLWNWSIASFRKAISEVAPDGTLPREIERKRRALHYHLFAAAPLVIIAEFGCANDLELYSENHGALVRLVNRSLAGLIDNAFFTQKSGVPQDAPAGLPTAEEIGWAKPFLDRFPNARFQKLLRSAPTLSYQFLGGLPPPASQCLQAHG